MKMAHKIGAPSGRQKGFVAVFAALCLSALIAMLALGVDLGRLYIAKNEAQTYVDSAALAGTLELDGTLEGLSRARAVALANTNRWNFQTSTFQGVTVDFSKLADGPWEEYPPDPHGYKYVRVLANAPVPMIFLPIVPGVQKSAAIPSSAPLALVSLMPMTKNIKANSAAGQEPKYYFREGLFPFSPFAHSTVAPHFGLVPGGRYTLRWASSPHLNQNTCPGDNVASMITLAQAGGGDERGFIEVTSSSVIRETIEFDAQTIFRTVGDSVVMTGGAKQTQRDSLLNRVAQDTDSSAADFAAYLQRDRGNGRRLVAVPINTGFPAYRIVQIGAFFLLPSSEYGNGGNKPFCAEYVGSWVKGSRHQGVDDTGAFVARLVR
jgi:hypothetical protein